MMSSSCDAIESRFGGVAGGRFVFGVQNHPIFNAHQHLDVVKPLRRWMVGGLGAPRDKGHNQGNSPPFDV
jgi:hypothetical protein